MKNIKVAFFDVDWTLFDHNSHSYVESALEGIRNLQKNGIKCFVCSARSYACAKEFGVLDCGVKWDGGIFSAGSTGFIKNKLLYTEKIPQHEVKRFVSLMHKYGVTVEVVGVKATCYSKKSNEFVKDYRKVFIDKDPHKRKLDGKTVTCFLAFAPEELDSLIQKEFPGMYLFRFHKYGLDCKFKPHHKGDGVKKVLEYYGYSKDEAMGFGDDIQDISIAENVGTFVAVGNAKDAVKKVAQFVTKPIWDDGIYSFLKEQKLI